MTFPRSANKVILAAVFSILAALFWGGPVSAMPILSVGVPGYSSESFSFTDSQGHTSYYGPDYSNTFNVYIGGWTGTLSNGTVTQNLPYIYCVDISGVIYVPGHYSTTVTNNGQVYGHTVPNLGKVTALLDAYAVSDENNLNASAALQLAIWKVLYGSSFTVTDFGNSTVGSDYNAYLAYANNNTTNTYANYQWLSPVNTDGSPTQGLVTGGGSGSPFLATPEPSSLILFGSLAIGMAGCGWVRRKRLPAVS